MKIYYFLIMLFFGTLNSNGQITFQKYFGGYDHEIGHAVQQTFDGGYILLGLTQSYGNGLLDIYLIKTDEQGNEIWSQTFGTENNEFGNSVMQTNDGGYIICGVYAVTNSINDSLVLIKTDQFGNEVWNKRYSGSVDRDIGLFVQQTSDNGFIAIGNTGSFENEDIYMLKTDSNGNELWNKVHYSVGYEVAYGVRQTSDGGYIAIGQTNNNPNGGADMFLLKTNSIGDTTWTRTYGTALNETGRAIYLTQDNGFILLGYEGEIGGNLILIKTDSLGIEQWSEQYGSGGSDFGYAVQQTFDGGYFVAGSINNTMTGTNDMYCIKTNSSGIEEWSASYPNGWTSTAFSAQQTTDGGYILFGNMRESSLSDYDMYLVKINSLGVVSLFENDFSSSPINVYPNPFSEYCDVEILNLYDEDLSVSILNIDGQVIKLYNNISTDKIRIDRKNLANGQYIITLKKGENTIGTSKLVIK